MNKNERWVITAILLGTSFFVGLDLVSDARETGLNWHVVIEAMVAIAALFGVFYLLRGSFALRHSLESEQENSLQLQVEAHRWRAESKKYLAGLSQIIDQQLTDWGLTNSEKEVAFLLLKGLSLKEIAEVRHTSERTARTQSTAIYSKAGLAGRSELAAFFLEDLLPPDQNMSQT